MTLLYQWLQQAAKDQGNHKAVVYRDNYLSWRGLLHRVDRRAQELQSIGIEPGAWVGLMLGNVPDFLILALALSKMDTVVVPIDPTTGSRELELMLQAAPLRALVTRPRGSEGSISATGTSVPIATSTRQKPPTRPPSVVGGSEAAEVRRRLQGTLLTCSVYKRDPRPVPEQPLAVLFTADSGGDPRGAARTTQSTSAALTAAIDALEMGAEDTMLVASPLFHAYGWDLGLMPALRLGATMLLEEETSGRRIGKILREHEATVFPGMPTMYAELAKLPTAKKLEPKHPRFLCSGSPLDPTIAAEFKAQWGIAPLSCYHSTEASLVAVDLSGEQPTTVGKVIPGVELMITGEYPADDPPAPKAKKEKAGSKVSKSARLHAPAAQAAGKPGLLWLRGKGLAPFSVGPFDGQIPPRQGQVAIGERDSDGWVRTGDVGIVDKAGRLTLAAREDGVVKIDGKRVALAEVTGCIESHHKVKAANAMLVADPLAGAMVVAQVVVTAPCPAEDIIDHCARNLAPYKVPRRIEFRDKLGR